jgi:hypothetical protein
MQIASDFSGLLTRKLMAYRVSSGGAQKGALAKVIPRMAKTIKNRRNHLRLRFFDAIGITLVWGMIVYILHSGQRADRYIQLIDIQ